MTNSELDNLVDAVIRAGAGTFPEIFTLVHPETFSSERDETRARKAVFRSMKRLRKNERVSWDPETRWTAVDKEHDYDDRKTR